MSNENVSHDAQVCGPTEQNITSACHVKRLCISTLFFFFFMMFISDFGSALVCSISSYTWGCMLYLIPGVISMTTLN